MNKKKKTYMILGIVGGILYLFVVLFFIHYMIMKEELKGSDESVLTAALNDLATQPFAIFPFPIEALLYIFLITISVAFFAYAAALNMKNRRAYNPKTVHGDAKWLKDQFLDDYDRRFAEPFGKPGHDGKNNMILSKEMFMSLDNRGIADNNNHQGRNMNVFAIGGSGAGKSFGLVGPNIMQANCSFCVTDPSGELYRNYSWFLEKEGYQIKVFNLSHMERGNHYNPFRYIHNDKDIEVLVSTLIANTTPENASGGDPFWEKSETALLLALIAYLFHYGTERDRNFSTVMRLLRAAEIDENDSSAQSGLDLLFQELVDKGLTNEFAYKQYRTFKMGAGKTLKSILISAAVRLQQFDLEDVANLTDTDDIDLDSIVDTKTALFVIIPTGDKTFNFIATMMYSQMFQRFYQYCENTVVYSQVVKNAEGEVVRVFRADSEEERENEAKKKAESFLEKAKSASVKEEKKYGLFTIRAKDGTSLGYSTLKDDAEKMLHSLKNGTTEKWGKARLPIHLRFLFDEFANTGKPANFQELVATIRKYDMSVTIILQSLQQMKNLYEKEWEAITGNCDNAIYLGGGADTVTTKWVSELLGKETRVVLGTSYNSGNSGSQSYNPQGEDLLNPAQLRTLPEDECIVIPKSLAAYKGKKYNATEHPNWKYCNGSHQTVFNAERQEDLYLEYMKSFKTDKKKKSIHGNTAISPEEKQKLDKAKNEMARARAEEIKNNRDANGNQIISSPEAVNKTGAGAIEHHLKAKSPTDIKETTSSLVNDNEDFPYDELTFTSVKL